MGGWVRWLRADGEWPYFYVLCSFFTVYCGPAGGFVLSAGTASVL